MVKISQLFFLMINDQKVTSLNIYVYIETITKTVLHDRKKKENGTCMKFVICKYSSVLIQVDIPSFA